MRLERRAGILLVDGDDASRESVARLVPKAGAVIDAASPTALAEVGKAPWWLVVERGALLEPNVLDRAFAHMRTLPRAMRGEVKAWYANWYGMFDGHVAWDSDPGGWSQERARWQDYTGRAALVRSRFVSDALGQGQAWLRHRALVAAGQRGRVQHVREPWYTTSDEEVRALPRSLREQLVAAADCPYTLTDGERPRRLAVRPSVSIVIPTRGSSGTVHDREQRMVDLTLASLQQRTTGFNPQIVLVVDDDVPTDFAERWRRALPDRVVVVPASPPFNFSAKINAGVRAADGDVVVMLNDDIEVITTEWLSEMTAIALEPDVGAVGALLVYENGTIQHAGQAFGSAGVHNVDAGAPLDDRGHGRNLVDRDVTGVTAACLVQRREVWAELGGLDPMLPVNFNDVDYCARIRALGYRIVQCNSVRLYHYESKTRLRGAEPWEVAVIRGRIGSGFHEPDPLTTAERNTQRVRLARTRYRLSKTRRLLADGGPGAVVSELRARRHR